jgi:hypothetical protein
VPPGAAGAEGPGVVGPQLAHLRDALGRTGDDLGLLRAQLEQKDAAMELMQRNFETQVGWWLLMGCGDDVMCVGRQ